MPINIDRDRLRRMLQGPAQLVEVLPRKDYEEEHLPRAINIPLPELSAQTTDRLSPDRPVIVYCWDSA